MQFLTALNKCIHVFWHKGAPSHNKMYFVLLCSVDLEVWNKRAKRAIIKGIVSKFVHDLDCDWQSVNMFSDTRSTVLQIICCSDTKVPVLVMECKRASVIYVYDLIFLLHSSRLTEYYRCMNAQRDIAPIYYESNIIKYSKIKNKWYLHGTVLDISRKDPQLQQLCITCA